MIEQLAEILKTKGLVSTIECDSLVIKHADLDIEEFIKDWAKQNFVEVSIKKENRCAPTCPICQGDNPIVRVAGFSAYFMDMATEVQDQIIARTQQRL